MSKSTTILHFCNVKNEMINGIFDNTPTKIGKYFPGKKIKLLITKNSKISNQNTVFYLHGIIIRRFLKRKKIILNGLLHR